jgi:hypothetical protein
MCVPLCLFILNYGNVGLGIGDPGFGLGVKGELNPPSSPHALRSVSRSTLVRVIVI